jgi:chitosanase
VRLQRRTVGVLAAATMSTVVAAMTITTSAGAATSTLLSLGKPVTASSQEAAAFTPNKAVDGNTTTRWASIEGVDPQWLKVDLGQTSQIDRVQLRWEAAFASSYTIAVSNDGVAWTTIYSTTTGDGAIDNLVGLQGSGRYVRVNGTKRGTAWGYSLFEFEVYGSNATTSGAALDTPAKKEIAMQLVSSAENSSLDWRAQYSYIQDIADGRGYTGGLIGFTSGTGDMLELVQRYTTRVPNNPLAPYLPALRNVNGTASHAGLGTPFVNAWKAAAARQDFKDAQDQLRDEWYFNPAVAQAKADGLQTLGQFVYYDAIVMHGPGTSFDSFGGIRAAAIAKAKPPSQGGSEVAYLNAFMDARKVIMLLEAAHADTSRIDMAQRVFLQQGNLTLSPPLRWSVYGDPYEILS